MPVGQPDGGRDAWDSTSESVLQVKFKRKDEDDNADWMIDALNGELPKIQRLIGRGAKAYVMVTNAQGTSHPDAGRIDRVQKWLNDNVSVPAVCFWRDDIDRRLEKSPTSLRLKYSEILTLEDGLDVLLTSIFGESAQRQDDALRAFVASQFNTDSTVKFKQVHLSNDLLDLFIDVPIGFPQKSLKNRALRETSMKFFDAIRGSASTAFVENADVTEVLLHEENGFYRQLDLGTAELLLSSAAQEHLRFVVIEGAPGQGKSTLAQYVCQVHRAKYLGDEAMLLRVSDALRTSSFRLPVKMDLRDYAAFLNGASPFANDATKGKARTLDVFISELITYHSGGIDFSPHEVLTLLKSAPVLLFLDGLDEVADVTLRDQLITSVGEAINRWSAFSCDVQIVVTSRPSVFGRPASLEKHGFATLTLKNIDQERIDLYADKWISARGLDDIERRDVKKILGEKLELAHIRDLTRNPMQLTILLSLIHQIGHSLPDQRTDLYRRYVDLFLTREADKSVLVREHRLVLLDFIQFLAWTLQSQSESTRSAGSIGEEDLQTLAKQYMRREGQPEEIAQNLFGGGLERIFVLVERIEGLYEFEVQPLREYFCAQYLYATAPVGSYRDASLSGDRSQRFEALASNPFWMNVCRFYAGSAERGETGSLVLSLEELISNSDPRLSLHARRVALALVQDWVFRGVKFAQEQLLRAVFDRTGIAALILGDRFGEDLQFDVECGRDVVRDVVYDELMSIGADHRTAQLCRFLRFNGGEQLTSRFLKALDRKKGATRTSILLRMIRSGAASSMGPRALWELMLADDPARDHRLWRSAVLMSSETELALSIPELTNGYLSGILDWVPNTNIHSVTAFGLFIELLSTGRSRYIFRSIGWDIQPGDAVDVVGSDDPRIPAQVAQFNARVLELADTQGDDLGHLSPPSYVQEVVEVAREVFGDQWAICCMALRASAKAQTLVPEAGAESLFDEAIPLYQRVRYARMRRRALQWWQSQYEASAQTWQRMLWAVLVVLNTNTSTVKKLAPLLNNVVDGLDPSEFLALERAIHHSSRPRRRKAGSAQQPPFDLRDFSNRAAVCVARGFGFATFEMSPSGRLLRSEPFKSVWSSLTLEEKVSVLPDWKNNDAVSSWAADVMELQKFRYAQRAFSRAVPQTMSISLAAQVLNDPENYPSSWFGSAAFFLQRKTKGRPLEAVASEANWAFL